MSYVPYDMYADRINRASTIKHFGKVTQVVGLVIESAGPAIPIGRLCHIENHDGSVVQAEVVGFRDNRLLLMPYGPIAGINPLFVVAAVKFVARVVANHLSIRNFNRSGRQCLVEIAGILLVGYVCDHDFVVMVDRQLMIMHS